jgi:hypothetical protein
VWDDEIDETLLSELTSSYLKRLRFEQQQLAIMVANCLNGAPPLGNGTNASQGDGAHVSADTFQKLVMGTI